MTYHDDSEVYMLREEVRALRHESSDQFTALIIFVLIVFAPQALLGMIHWALITAGIVFVLGALIIVLMGIIRVIDIIYGIVPPGKYEHLNRLQLLDGRRAQSDLIWCVAWHDDCPQCDERRKSVVDTLISRYRHEGKEFDPSIKSYVYRNGDIEPLKAQIAEYAKLPPHDTRRFDQFMDDKNMNAAA